MPVAMPQSDEAVLARRAETVAGRLQPVAPMVSRRLPYFPLGECPLYEQQRLIVLQCVN